MDTHKQVNERLVAYVLDELSPPQRAEVEAHLAACPACRREMQQIERLDACSAELQKQSAGQEACASATRRILTTTANELTKTRVRERGLETKWRSIMSSRLSKLAAAAAVAIAVGAGTIAILHNGTPSAYAFEQTVDALAAKHSLHVKVWFANGRLKEEFWAEFDDAGDQTRFRQEEDDQVTVWSDNVKTRLIDNRILLRTRSNGQENVLEMDPQLMVQQLQRAQEQGRVTLEIQEPAAGESHIIVVATDGQDPERARWRHVLLVNPITKRVDRYDQYRMGDGGEWELFSYVEVPGYNEPIDAAVFNLDVPEDVAVMDQVGQDIGMVRGDLSEEELAAQLVQAALDAWGAEDYERAGKLFGGVSAEVLTGRLAELRPVGHIVVGEPVAVEHWRPKYEVPSRFDVERDGQVENVDYTWVVLGEISWQKVDDSPDRWWVDIRLLIKREMFSGPLSGDVGLPQGELSKEEIALKVARDFLEAVIAEDYARAGRLAGVQGEVIRRQLADDPKAVRIVSVGPPEPWDEGEPDHFRVPFVIEVDADGTKQTIANELEVEPVEDRPGWWEID